MLECITLYMVYNVLDVQLENPEKVLVMYNKTKLRPLGKCKVKIRNPRNNKLFGLEFQVVDHDDRIPILARSASEGMQLIKVQYEDILMIDSERWRTFTESRYLMSAPKRQQRMLHRLQMYDVVNIIYVSGQEMFLANPLSSASVYRTSLRDRLRQNLRPLT